jgi:hypothetical protein
MSLQGNIAVVTGSTGILCQETDASPLARQRGSDPGRGAALAGSVGWRRVGVRDLRHAADVDG